MIQGSINLYPVLTFHRAFSKVSISSPSLPQGFAVSVVPRLCIYTDSSPGECFFLFKSNAPYSVFPSNTRMGLFRTIPGWLRVVREYKVREICMGFNTICIHRNVLALGTRRSKSKAMDSSFAFSSKNFNMSFIWGRPDAKVIIMSSRMTVRLCTLAIPFLRSGNLKFFCQLVQWLNQGHKIMT